MYSQPPLMDRHHRGELRERGEQTEERKRKCVKEPVQLQQRRGTADLGSSTHAFSGGDVNRAGDVGEALVHAHLQVDHPAKQPNITRTHTHTADRSSANQSRRPQCIFQSSWAILASLAHKHASPPPTKGILSAWSRARPRIKNPQMTSLSSALTPDI